MYFVKVVPICGIVTEVEIETLDDAIRLAKSFRAERNQAIYVTLDGKIVKHWVKNPDRKSRERWRSLYWGSPILDEIAK